MRRHPSQTPNNLASKTTTGPTQQDDGTLMMRDLHVHRQTCQPDNRFLYHDYSRWYDPSAGWFVSPGPCQGGSQTLNPTSALWTCLRVCPTRLQCTLVQRQCRSCVDNNRLGPLLVETEELGIVRDRRLYGCYDISHHGSQ